MHIRRAHQIDKFTIFGHAAHAYMGVFPVAGNAYNRFGQERNFQSVGTENFLYQVAHQDFIIGSLYAVGRKLPVDFQLFIHVGHIAVHVQLSPDTAHFLVAHFRFQSIKSQYFHRLFQGRPHIAPGPCPILFLHDLGGGQGHGRNAFGRCLHPKFQFRGTGESNLFNIVRADRQSGYRTSLFHSF